MRLTYKFTFILEELKSLFPAINKNQQLYNARPLELFRMAFGAVVAIQALYFFQIGFIEKDIVKPIVHFPLFSFIQPFSESVLNILLASNLVAGIFITLGRYIKVALALFLITFTYLWSIDLGYYNNHYYLFSLLSFLLLIIPGLGQNGWKISRKDIRHGLPRWAFQLLKSQWFIVFFIAGLNKLNKYWLVDLQPMKATFAFKADYTGDAFWNNELWPLLFSYGGALFDLGIGFLLLFKKTRKLAFLLLLGFNLSNWLFFMDIGEIGIFPLLVISSILVFFDTIPLEKRKSNKQKTYHPKVLHYFLWTWIAFQFLFPLRHFLYQDYVDWTGEGSRFSWRMKIAYKEFDMQFYVHEEAKPDTKYPIAIEKTLSPKQYTNLGYMPDFLPVLGDFLADGAKKQGLKNPIITAEFQVGLNGYPKQYIIDPDLALNKTTFSSLKHNEWIASLKKN